MDMGERRPAARRLLALAALLGLTLVLLTAAPAPAQVYVGVPPPTVVPPPPTPPSFPPPLSNTGGRSPVGDLAVTGADIAGLVGVALGVLFAGLVLTRMGRRMPAFAGRSLLER